MKENVDSRQEWVKAGSHTNYRYLSSPEKKERMSNLYTRNKALVRQVSEISLICMHADTWL
jgi:hypothetical protein